MSMPLACSMPLRASAISATASETCSLWASFIDGGLVADDYDVVNLTSRVDDAVPGAERTGRPPDLFQRRHDLAVVIGVLVRQHQVGGRVHGAGVVAV